MPSPASLVLVGLQSLLILLLLVVTPWRSLVPPLLLFPGAGALLGGWAIAVMNVHHLRIFPEPHPGARLVTWGPYRWIRHPMYTSLLIFFLPAWLAPDAAMNVGLWIALHGVLVLKVLREERLLAGRFPEYADYQRRSWRLWPDVW